MLCEVAELVEFLRERGSNVCYALFDSSVVAHPLSPLSSDLNSGWGYGRTASCCDAEAREGQRSAKERLPLGHTVYVKGDAPTVIATAGCGLYPLLLIFSRAVVPLLASPIEPTVLPRKSRFTIEKLLAVPASI